MSGEDEAEELAPYRDLAELSNIDKGLLSTTQDWIDSSLINRLLQDARGLYDHGVYTSGKLGGMSGKKVENKQRRMCDTCGLFDDAAEAGEEIGNYEARLDLFDHLADLRDELSETLGRTLAEGLELQYLHYPGHGGFYNRHLDHGVDDDNKELKRSISFLLYLNNYSGGWNEKQHGGALVAYPSSGTAQIKVPPTGGTLVLFDSASVEHEVLPSISERWALVGWFLESASVVNHRRTKQTHDSDNEQKILSSTLAYPPFLNTNSTEEVVLEETPQVSTTTLTSNNNKKSKKKSKQNKKKSAQQQQLNDKNVKRTSATVSSSAATPSSSETKLTNTVMSSTTDVKRKRKEAPSGSKTQQTHLQKKKDKYFKRRRQG